ncbi:unnamed protein product [Owenia fusiformis]|uniref:Uncharacterized protein n=1 Tax=Owenia fusiformis TaxID=6347 RepID=A0A8J1V0P9_OWEFU|nr:unnamed protein product [Owenia fusiformis]
MAKSLQHLCLENLRSHGMEVDSTDFRQLCSVSTALKTVYTPAVEDHALKLELQLIVDTKGAETTSNLCYFRGALGEALQRLGANCDYEHTTHTQRELDYANNCQCCSIAPQTAYQFYNKMYETAGHEHGEGPSGFMNKHGKSRSSRPGYVVRVDIRLTLYKCEAAMDTLLSAVCGLLGVPQNRCKSRFSLVLFRRPKDGALITFATVDDLPLWFGAEPERDWDRMLYEIHASTKFTTPFTSTQIDLCLILTALSIANRPPGNITEDFWILRENMHDFDTSDRDMINDIREHWGELPVQVQCDYLREQSNPLSLNQYKAICTNRADEYYLRCHFSIDDDRYWTGELPLFQSSFEGLFRLDLR